MKSVISEKLFAMALAVLMLNSVFVFQAGAAENPETAITSAGDLPNLNKTFYLHTLDKAVHIGSLTTLNTFNTTVGTNFEEISSSMRIVAKWHLFPVLAGPVNLTGNVNLTLWMKFDGTMPTNTPPEWIVEVREVSNEGDYLGTIASGNTPIGLTKTYQETHSVININGSYVVNATSSIEILFRIKDNEATTYYVAWGNATYDSRVTFECKDYIQIENAWAQDWEGTAKAGFDQDELNKNVSIWTDVTDPFGGYDINWVNISLQYPDLVNYENATMYLEEGHFNSYRSMFKWDWNYSGKPSGRYNVTITALDNTGYYYNLTNTGYGGHLVNFTFYFIIGSSNYVNVRFLDTMGVTLNNTGFQVFVGPSLVAVGTTNGTGMANISLAGGVYGINAVWQDVAVPSLVNGTLSVEGNVTWENAINITSGVYYKPFRLVDSRDQNLSNAAVYVTHPNGTTTITPYKTDANGIFNLYRTAGGDYELSAIWLGVRVYSGIRTVNSNAETVLDCSVYYMDVYAYDSDGVGIESTQIVIYDNETGIVRDSRLTNESGGIQSRLPGGIYDVMVYWQGSVVGTALDILLDQDIRVDVICGVFRVTITILDDMNMPVSEAKVSVISGDSGNLLATNTTNQDGNTSVRLPVGNHPVEVLWRDVMVYSDSVYFDGSDVTLNVGVHHLTLEVVDARGLPVENAYVSVRNNDTGRALESGMTDAAGTIVARLPGSMLNISVTWQDVPVNRTVHDLTETQTLTLGATIYYVTFRVVDSDSSGGSPVPNARIVIRHAGRTLDSNDTNSNGEILSRLPASDIELVAWWQDVEVASVTMTVDETVSEATIPIPARIFYLNVIVLDVDVQPVPGAQVTFRYISSGRILASEFTDSDGNCAARLPHGNIGISVSWRDVVVNTTAHDLVSNHTLIVDASIFYLSLSVMDAMGAPLDGAVVRVIAVSDGSTVETWTANATGNASFRLPGAEFELKVLWMDTEVYSMTLVLDENIHMDIHARVYRLDLTIHDQGGLALEGATVLVKGATTERVFLSGVTGSDGRVGGRIPGTDIDINIFWQDADVGEFSRTMSDNRTETLTALVGYVDFDMTDSREHPVERADTVIRYVPTGRVLGTGLTDRDGRISLRLPRGQVEIAATWDSVEVLRQTLTLSGLSETVHLHPGIYYFQVSMLDSRDIALAGAYATLTMNDTGRLHAQTLTDSLGGILARLPNGAYSLDVAWKGASVFSDVFELYADIVENLTASVYYWSLTVSDVNGVPVAGGDITIRDTAALMWKGYTDAGGLAVARLPMGSYEMETVWKGVPVNSTGITLLADAETDVFAGIYYLTVTVTGNDDKGLANVFITVFDRESGQRVDSGTTDAEGRKTFRLPRGNYDLKAVYRGNYLLTPVNLDAGESVDLTTGSRDSSMKIEEYPLPIHTTNLFFIIMIFVILLAVLAYYLWRRKGKKGEPTEEAAEPEVVYVPAADPDDLVEP